MIRVVRVAEPRGLHDTGGVWGQELCDARVVYYQELGKYQRREIQIKPKKPDADKKKYASQSVKNALGKMFVGKCCYCESKVEAVSYLNVEHFRPQSIYPKLAYRWTNLLYACERCNSSHKRDKFPIAPDEQTVREDAGAPCRRDDTDGGLLVDPCHDDPTEHFAYRFIGSDVRTGIDVVLICLNRRAEITRNVCGLDREDLSDARRGYLQHVCLAVEGYQIAKQIDAQDMIDRFVAKLREFMNAGSGYSAMAQAYIVQECGFDF